MTTPPPFLPSIAELLALGDGLLDDLRTASRLLDERLDERALAWIAGRDEGYAAGWRDGRQDALDHAAHAANYTRLQSVWAAPQRDPEADRAAAERRDRRWRRAS